jgi:hypothetical protein
MLLVLYQVFSLLVATKYSVNNNKITRGKIFWHHTQAKPAQEVLRRQKIANDISKGASFPAG